MKRLLIASILALVATPLAAQQPERTFTITITATQLGQIGNALGEQKFKDVAGVIMTIQQQVEAQTKPPAAQPSAPPETPAPDTSPPKENK